ncbi:actin-binding protein IPP-like [Gigantopelta aegis]|uniref:actin-binding protein IPP-like n=1 Tax=Gigantopelta aegis TaxID=1735272 RepID=UPI001B88DC7F|nr:actin-binding protein IPP-like [Gigantopelta aegis]
MEVVQTQLLQNIHQEMINGSFSDIQVICNGETTTGSRLVLAALSPYFRAMFASGMTESRTGILKLPSVSLTVYQDILKMYFCKLNLINDENCMDILDAAEMMQLDHIKNLCNTYLKQTIVITPQNWLNWWRTLKVYNFLDLSKRALSCFIDNLADKTENVIQLSKAELLEIISKHDLNCKEDDILKVAMQWIEHNNPKQEDVQSIFENVRLDIVDRQFLVNEVAFTDIVLENSAVKKMMQNVLGSNEARKATTRMSALKRPVAFVLLHTDTSLLSCFTSEEKWEDVSPAPVDPGPGYSAASLDDKIYITGGLQQGKCTLVYDTIRKVWNVGPYLNHEHCNNCTVTACSKVYVMSGRDTSTIEEKSESEAQWQVVADFGLDRVGAFPVTVDENVLVMGGEINENPTDLIQCFNTTIRAVTKLDTKLPCVSSTLRGSIHLPDVYLLDYDGEMMHIHVTDRNVEIQVENKRTGLLDTFWYKRPALWNMFEYKRTSLGDMFGCGCGILLRHGNLMCFTEDGISKLNVADWQEEEGTFPEPPRSGVVYNVLTV